MNYAGSSLRRAVDRIMDVNQFKEANELQIGDVLVDGGIVRQVLTLQNKKTQSWGTYVLLSNGNIMEYPPFRPIAVRGLRVAQ